MLPPPCEDIEEVLAILFTGPSKPTPEDFARTPFLVRRNAVINALEWLKLNHADYADIEISNENMAQYEETMPPVSIEYRPAETNKVPEGTSVFDCEEEDGTTEGDCAFTVHGLTGRVVSYTVTTKTPSERIQCSSVAVAVAENWLQPQASHLISTHIDKQRPAPTGFFPSR